VILLRSILFNILFYLNIVLYLLIAMPAAAISPQAVIAVAKQWGRVNLWMLRHVCGLSVEWRGLEKIPPGGLIVAAKHQSAWETFALLTILEDPIFVLKTELMWIPVFGWCMRKAGMIPVDRGAGRAALSAMTARVRGALADGRQIIIFPEGTRRPPGAPPKYKFGVAFVYEDAAAPCVPIALNSGLYWPRRRFLRFPGKVRVEVLDPIPPGLDRRAFFTDLEQMLEAATARLIAEGLRELGEAGRAHFETAQSEA
jgi:1-acyl-sn-glycerol-3-phosphate acyltransferase